ncbi:hypothetical protein OC844_000616 [Tilletia horrida]|nr:hypothetical protein OC844_000616 [Tilletia horrida]
MDISSWRQQVHDKTPRSPQRADPRALGDRPHPAWQCERLPLTYQERVRLFFLWSKTEFRVLNFNNKASRDELIEQMDSFLEYGLEVLQSTHEEMEDELRDGGGTFFVCPHHDPHNASYRTMPFPTLVSEVRFGSRPFHRVRALANRAGSDVPADASDDSVTATETSMTDPDSWSRHSTTWSGDDAAAAPAVRVPSTALVRNADSSDSPASALGQAMRRGLRMRSHSAPPVPTDAQVSDFRSASVYALLDAFHVANHDSTDGLSEDGDATSEVGNDLLSQPLTQGPVTVPISPPSLQRVVAIRQSLGRDAAVVDQENRFNLSQASVSHGRVRDCSESVFGRSNAVQDVDPKRGVLRTRPKDPSPPGTPNGMPPPPTSPLRWLSWDPANPEGKLRSGSGGFLRTPGPLLCGPVPKRQRRR